MANDDFTAGGQQEWLHFIFFNPGGLRPGWRLLIFIALYRAVSYGVALLLRPVAARLPPGLAPSSLIFYEGLALLVLVFCTWIMSRIELRDMGEYGLPLRNAPVWRRFLRGYLFWGFLPLTVFLLGLRALHAFYFGSLALHGREIFSWAAVWALVFVLVALWEEYSLRGYLLYTLADGIGFWPAAIVLACLFGLAHMFNGGETRTGIMMAALFAMFASVTLRYTGNLWLAVGAHAGWDWGESYFYGVNDSGLQAPGHLLNSHIQGPQWLNGGTTGPEGSILCLVLLTVMSVLFVLLYRKARLPALVVTRA